jgi:uncharacterized C2H2 Zn-finger protein
MPITLPLEYYRLYFFRIIFLILIPTVCTICSLLQSNSIMLKELRMPCSCLRCSRTSCLIDVKFNCIILWSLYSLVLCVISGPLESTDSCHDMRPILSEILDCGSAVEHNTEVNSQLQVNPGRNFSCQRCGNVYKYKRNLTRHVTFECGQIPQFHCLYCPARYTRSNNLMLHMEKVHNWSDEFVSLKKNSFNVWVLC